MTHPNKNNRQKWKYPDLASARQPVPVLDDIHIPSFHILPDISEDEINFDIDSDCTEETSSPSLFNQNELNDLIRDLRLSKEASELLASR